MDKSYQEINGVSQRKGGSSSDRCCLIPVGQSGSAVELFFRAILLTCSNILLLRRLAGSCGWEVWTRVGVIRSYCEMIRIIESTDEDGYRLNDMYEYRVGCDSNKLQTGMRPHHDAFTPLESAPLCLTLHFLKASIRRLRENSS